MSTTTTIEDETLTLKELTRHGIDRHGLYGLHQYHGWGGKRSSINFTGSARGRLEARAVDLAKARHPHGVMIFSFLPHKTVITVDRQLETRALYCEITRILQGRSITVRERRALHRVRDAVMDHAERNAEDNPNPTEPITTDDPVLQRAKSQSGKATGGFQVDQVELTDERPDGL